MCLFYFTIKVFIAVGFCFGNISVEKAHQVVSNLLAQNNKTSYSICLLYTSDAADED